MPDFDTTSVRLPDGYVAHARFWPTDASPRGAILYLHGIQSHAGWYEASARALQQAGYAVLQPDRRGSGRNALKRGHAQSAAELIDDAVACGAALVERSGHADYHLLGVSWGGRLACALRCITQAPIRSLNLVCPGLFPRVDVTPAQKFRIGLSMVGGGGDRLYDIPLNDPRLFTHDAQWLAFLESDALRLMQVTAQFFLATRRMDRYIRELTTAPPCPCHLFVAGDDAIVDAARTVAWARSLTWPAVVIHEYAAARHTLEFDTVRERYVADLLAALRQADH